MSETNGLRPLREPQPLQSSGSFTPPREPQLVREPHELSGASLRHPSEHLTDNYRKNEESNNYKLLDIDHQENKKIRDTIKLIEAWRDMDKAEGFTLDKIGKNVLELRENRPDPEYRKAIKIKIRGNLSAGLIEDLNAIAEILFEDNFVSVSETWYQEDYNFEPAAVAMHFQNAFAAQMLGGCEQGQDQSQSQSENRTRSSNFWRNMAFITEIVKAGGIGIYNRLTEEWDVNTYHAGVTNMLIREYITADTEPIPTDNEIYAATGTALSIREFISESFPMPDETVIHTATGTALSIREFISESFPMPDEMVIHTATAVYETRREELMSE